MQQTHGYRETVYDIAAQLAAQAIPKILTVYLLKYLIWNGKELIFRLTPKPADKSINKTK